MPHVDLVNGRLHYEFDGPDDGRVLVLSNSIGAGMGMWIRVVPDLAKRFRILRYDTRGHGASSVPDGPYTMADLGSDVLALLDALDIRRCIFCGLSMGGMTGIWLAIHAPERLEKLILANTAARIGTQESWNERILAVRNGGMASIADVVLERWFTLEFRQAKPAIVSAVRQMLIEISPEGYAHCCAAIRDADFTANLKEIEIPALIITGREDPATPPGDGRVLAQTMPRASYVELETSHQSAIESADGFSAAVLKFLLAEEG